MGTMNCPKGYLLVTDEVECRDSAAFLGKAFASVGCFEVDRAGCHINHGRIYLSTCSKTQYRDSAPVCKHSGKV